MIERWKKGDALDATEDFLLVPVARRSTDANGGFAAQVFATLPETQKILETIGGLYLGDFTEVGRGRVMEWPKPYTVILAAMHRRDEAGWEDAPSVLSGVLAQIHERYAGKRLAVAGNPGRGFSGFLGRADDFEISSALQRTKVPIVVYRRTEMVDPEPRELVAPLPSDEVAAAEPAPSDILEVVGV